MEPPLAEADDPPPPEADDPPPPEAEDLPPPEAEELLQATGATDVGEASRRLVKPPSMGPRNH